MKKPLIVLLVILIILAAVGFVLPTSYRVEERVTIQANPGQVHEYVGYLEKWEDWAPWVKGDRSIQITYGDATTGVGASQSWTSEAGDGEVTLTKCNSRQGIAYDMVLIAKGTRAPAVCAMTYVANGAATDVVWTMEGDVAGYRPRVVAGYLNLFLKGSITTMLERGLKTLKAEVE